VHLYRCAGPACPGLPFPASERAHPPSCVGPVVEVGADAKENCIRLVDLLLSH